MICVNNKNNATVEFFHILSQCFHHGLGLHHFSKFHMAWDDIILIRLADFFYDQNSLYVKKIKIFF